MNKKELIASVALKAKKTQAEVKTVLDIVLSEISDTLQKEEEVALPDFGVFKLKTVPAKRKYVHLLKKEIDIPEKKKVEFKQYSNIMLYSQKYQ